MTASPKAAPDCATMEEVRAGIDVVDAELVRLLKRRVGYIDQAAVLKAPLNLPARIDWRVEEVVAKVRRTATDEGLDPALAETLWRQLIDWSIAREDASLRSDPAS